MAAARELVIADEPAAWARLGFLAGDDGALAVGGLRIRPAGRAAGEGLVELRVEGLASGRPDGLPIVAATAAGPAEQTAAAPAARGDAGPAEQTAAAPAARGDAGHPNGALAIDHVVVFTDDRDRTAAALVAAGGDERRRGEPPELPARMAFVRFGELVVEVAEAGGPPRFWGLTVTVADLEAVAGVTGPARPAVQPGRRIATVPRDAGIAVALAFITPRPGSNPPGARPAADSTGSPRSGTLG